MRKKNKVKTPTNATTETPSQNEMKQPAFILEILVEDAVLIAPGTSNAFKPFINALEIPFMDKLEAQRKLTSIQQYGLKLYNPVPEVEISVYPPRCIKRLTIVNYSKVLANQAEAPQEPVQEELTISETNSQ